MPVFSRCRFPLAFLLFPVHELGQGHNSLFIVIHLGIQKKNSLHSFFFVSEYLCYFCIICSSFLNTLVILNHLAVFTWTLEIACKLLFHLSRIDVIFLFSISGPLWLNSTLPLCVCSLCLCVPSYIAGTLPASLCVYGGQCLTLVSSLLLSTLVFQAGSLLDQQLSIGLAWLVIELPSSVSPCLQY